MAFRLVCDECGSDQNVRSIVGMTGRVLIDGIDNNRQGCDLCEDHYPSAGAHQPHNCKHVRFYWGDAEPEWNKEEL
jgi:hypothetical protein